MWRKIWDPPTALITLVRPDGHAKGVKAHSARAHGPDGSVSGALAAGFWPPGKGDLARGATWACQPAGGLARLARSPERGGALTQLSQGRHVTP